MWNGQYKAGGNNKRTVTAATYVNIHNDGAEWLQNLNTTGIFVFWEQWMTTMTHWISNLQPQPTTVVISSREWPIHAAHTNIRRVLEAAFHATKKSGIVLWRGGFPTRGSKVAKQSEVDSAGTS
jgi:hypothetical protein